MYFTFPQKDLPNGLLQSCSQLKSKDCNLTRIHKNLVSQQLLNPKQLSDIATILRKEFLDIQATIECRFTLNVHLAWQKHADNYKSLWNISWKITASWNLINFKKIIWNSHIMENTLQYVESSLSAIKKLVLNSLSHLIVMSCKKLCRIQTFIKPFPVMEHRTKKTGFLNQNNW